MFPRNIRIIYPWKIAQICQILKQSLNDNEWTQESQNEFSALLTALSLKSQNYLVDEKSGGGRTYTAQLESLGLIYKKGKKIFFTRAGKSLIDFDRPLTVIQTQLLNYQYPSSYSLNRNVRINPKMRIKPFVFALKFMRDPDINYLVEAELIFLLVYGHDSGCYDFVKDKIISFRKQGSTNSVLSGLIDDPLNDLYTPRSIAKGDIAVLLEAAKNVANTMKNYMVPSSLVFVDKVTKHICISTEFEDIISKSIATSDQFLPYSPGNDEAFLRAYGSWDQQKDTILNIERKKLTHGEAIISSHYFAYIGKTPVVNTPEAFINNMKALGFSRASVEEVINPLISKSLSFFESHYLELSKGGTATATAFEKATAELFLNTFMIESVHTGSLHRKGVGGFSDILMKFDELNEVGIVDTKASSSYTLPSTDHGKMVSNYIANYKQLKGVGKRDLGFVLYVAGGLSGEIHSKLFSIFSLTGIPASAISAKNLIDISQLQAIKKIDFWSGFKLNRVLTVSDFKVKDVNI